LKTRRKQEQAEMTEAIETIYPTDIFRARDQAIARNPKDKNGFGAFRIVGKGSKTKNQATTFYPFEVCIDGKWKRVSLKFINLTHVGKIAPLEERAKSKVQDIALLFKADYSYKRMVTETTPDGKPILGADGKPKKNEITEEYGKAKDFICTAFMKHVEKHQQKGEMFSASKKITPNVKHWREDNSGGKITKVPIEPANINVGIKFAGQNVSDSDKKNKATKFKTLILDANRPKDVIKKGDWPFEVAKARFTVKKDDGSTEELAEDICNGNIHHFLRGGSLITGFDDMSAVCDSAQQVSLPSQLEVAIVKPGASTKHTASHFDDDDFALIAGAKVEEPKTTAAPLPSAAAAEISAASGVAAPDEFGDAPADEFTPAAPTEDLEF
jgi:hypothetical protein